MKIEDTFYTFDTQKQLDGKFFLVSSLKFPTKLGLTGRCFAANIPIMSVNEPQKNKYYQSEVDNTTGASTVINLMIGKTFVLDS